MVHHDVFHRFLLLTEIPAEWSALQVVSGPLGLAVAAGWLWARVAGVPLVGWVVALSLGVFLVVDWGVLAQLPRRGRSYGAVQPPLLALALLRGCLALTGVVVARHWPWPALLSLTLIQGFTSFLLVYGTWVEPFRVQVSHVAISTSVFPSSASPLRIVQLSDLHVERLTPRERALPDLVAKLAPDLIVLTGDYLSTSYTHDVRAMADLYALLAKLDAPGGIWAVWGTIEVDRPDDLRPGLQDLGITVLENQAVEVSVADRRLWLVGLPSSRDLDGDGAMLRALLAEVPQDRFATLLYHTPDLMPQAAALGLDLYLAGHTHGGQWRLPGFGAILTSSEYGKRYEAGSYREGNTHLYVSRGLGLEGFGAPRARFFCRPEVVSITVSGTGKRDDSESPTGEDRTRNSVGPASRVRLPVTVGGSGLFHV